MQYIFRFYCCLFKYLLTPSAKNYDEELFLLFVGDHVYGLIILL